MNLVVTLIEKNNSESPNIGTVIYHNGKQFKSDLNEALENHFDAKIIDVFIKDGLKITDVLNSPPIDAVVHLEDEDFSYEIEIQQTWLYGN